MTLQYLPIMAPIGGSRPPRLVVSSRLKPWSPTTTPLAAARVALLTSSAVRLRNQPEFLPRDDTSYRAIPFDAPASELQIDHRSPVGSDARRDLEIVAPRKALEELARQGVIGGVAPLWFSFSGGIQPLPQIEEELAPALADELEAAGTDLAALVPY